MTVDPALVEFLSQHRKNKGIVSTCNISQLRDLREIFLSGYSEEQMPVCVCRGRVTHLKQDYYNALDIGTSEMNKPRSPFYR